MKQNTPRRFFIILKIGHLKKKKSIEGFALKFFNGTKELV